MTEVTNNQIEQRNPRPRIISLGEEIHPFDPKENPDKNFNFILKIDNKKFPIRIRTESGNLPKDRSLTPFNPGLGYEIDSDDLTLKARTTKIQSIHAPETFEENIASRLDPSSLYPHKFTNLLIDSVGLIFHRHGLNEDIKERSGIFKFPNETLGLLRRLRVIVKLPMETFEGRPSEFYLSRGELTSELFYIKEKGPLATSGLKQQAYEEYLQEIISKSKSPQERALEHLLTMEGLFLVFPNDPEVLEQITVQFVLADEKPAKTIYSK